MTKRPRYSGEGCGWIWAGLRMRAYYYPAEISSENLLPIRADFVTERDTASILYCRTNIHEKRVRLPDQYPLRKKNDPESKLLLTKFAIPAFHAFAHNHLVRYVQSFMKKIRVE